MEPVEYSVGLEHAVCESNSQFFNLLMGLEAFHLTDFLGIAHGRCHTGYSRVCSGFLCMISDRM
jgi:hypothetical protein